MFVIPFRTTLRQNVISNLVNTQHMLRQTIQGDDLESCLEQDSVVCGVSRVFSNLFHRASLLSQVLFHSVPERASMFRSCSGSTKSDQTQASEYDM